ncbi:TVP38/TMEM64 family protein [Lachnoclostridium sp. Marseille-P6806]|uniref:TVP38/TMEM64 family protein n=1 Tax=Lachnoclostridium sp. Marseille-P6806 TaxID=2364793 RepID=UPI00102F3339|nr:VTT domain-containing protein [Lachnoclostridium sp. Marseille-P6806]
MRENGAVHTGKIRGLLRAVAVTAGLFAAAWLLWHAFGKLLPELIPLLRHGDSERIAAYLEAEGKWTGMLSVFVLAFFQVVSIFFPGTPIQIAAGAIYGWLEGFLICFSGYWSANMAVFFFARRMHGRTPGRFRSGRRAAWLMDRLNSTQPGFVIMIACLVPGVPNGFVPYLAAESRIHFAQFAEAVAAGCFLPILSSCLTGRFLLEGKYAYGVAAIAIQLAVIALVLVKRDRILERLEKKEREKPEARQEV